MAQPSWETSNEDTDARDVEALVQQPESTDDYTVIDLHLPELFKTRRRLDRLKNELRRKFSINVLIERPRDCSVDDVLRVEGYSIDRNALLRAVRRHDSSATIVS